MIEIRSPWKRVRDREKRAARGPSFVAKVKATKLVWFPPRPVETGKETASAAKKATKRATQKTTNGTKNDVTNPLRRKTT